MLAYHGGGKDGRNWMSMTDTNQDGRVSADEYARHCQMMFDKIDTNKDGYIDKDEAAQARKKHAHEGKEGQHRNWMSMIDTDQDGRVSAPEYARHCQMMFDKIDTNKDGYIDKDEAAQAKKRHAGSGYNKSGTPSDGSEMQHMKPMGQ